MFVGFDRPEALGESEQGATVAVPIWIDYMKQALKDSPESMMPRPDGLVDRLIERNSGAPARPGQSNTTFELFLAESAPLEQRSNQPAPASRSATRSDNTGSSNTSNSETLSTEILF